MKKNVYELTKPQLSIYMSEKIINVPINNIIGTMYFPSTVNIDLLIQAVNITVKNNQALRTIIFEKSGKPFQYFEDFFPFSLEFIDFTNKSLEEFKVFQNSFAQKMFNINENLLFEFVIVSLCNGEIALIGKFHHLIADAWSLGLIIDNIALNYYNLENNKKSTISPGLYTDFINRENNYLASDSYKKSKDFWCNELQGIEPISFKECISHSYKAKRTEFSLSDAETSLIDSFCKENHISAYILFLTAINLYLYKSTSNNKFSIQTPILNRIGKDKNTIGMFINMLSIPTTIEDNLPTNKLLENFSHSSIKYFKNSKYPYIDLLADLRKYNNTQSYNVVYSFQNMRPKNSLAGIIYNRAEWNFVGYMQDELVINITDFNNSGNYHISYDYLINLFTSKEIDFIHKRIKKVVFDIINSSYKSVSDINVLPNSEKNLLLNNFNNTSTKYALNTTIPDLFENIVAKYPENVALIYKDKNYTYKTLNNMANIVADNLTKLNIRNSRVAILCKKSAWLIAGLLGIMKSGNCYIPIDGEYPEKRIKYIIDNSKCNFIIVSDEYRNFGNFSNKIILEDLDITLTTNYKSIATPENLAYMIYTSGTTGNPKGVPIKHNNIINTLIWRKNTYNFDKSYTVLQIPSFSFDSSVEDIFTPLISGATLVIPSVSRMDVNVIAEELSKYNVNHFLVVPSLYKILLQEKYNFLTSLKIVTIAGEDFPMSLVKEHFKKFSNVRLINEYGPTENSVCSTFYELTNNDDSILIGKPISNCKAYILDKNMQLLPIKSKGELYVSGPGVSEGYWNNPNLNEDRFFKNPFGYNYKMYKTGDIAAWNFDGNIEYFGRNDEQVKLHGLRIELKEIEKNILQDSGVSDTIVLIKKNSSNNQILVAYITTYDINFNINSLYENLRKKLPFYMVPIIVKLDSFPLTPNGKVDKNKLPLPKLKTIHNAPPRNELENIILSICRKVLNNNNLGIFDDFFVDGNADSLSILTISSRLFADGFTVNTQDFYKYSSVETLAKYISNKNPQNIRYIKRIVKPKLTLYPKNVTKNDLYFQYQNVLLTGVTGFLGIHILDYLLKNTTCIIYCIVREKNNETPLQRIQSLLEFYFDSNYYIKFKNRIIVLRGELSEDFLGLSQENYSNLQKNVDCIINTAANTKHYGSYTDFQKDNVISVKNLILFAKPLNIILNHMSTTNVSGNYLVKNDISYNFTENDFYIGQNYKDNVYIHSKFDAEKLILEEEYKGLNANIFRLGNLMARYSDGTFQKNKYDNAYFSRLLALAKLGYLPYTLEQQKLEFSPIDETSEAIIKLLTIPNIKNNIFHIFSDKLIDINLLLDIFKSMNCICKFTDFDNFMQKLNLQKNEKILKYIVSDLTYSKKFDYKSNIIINQNLTNKFFDLVDFKWSKIDENYLIQFFNKVNFFKDIQE